MASSSPFSSSNNPFLAGAATDPFAAPAAAPTAEATTYAMIPSRPAVDASEVETTTTSLEIVVRWGDEILHIDHLTPPRAFSVGEAEGCDVVLPADRIGAARLDLVSVEGSEVRVNVPSHAKGSLVQKGQRLSLEDAIVAGLGSASTSGASLRLADGLRSKIEIGDFVIEIGAVKAGKCVAGKTSKDKRSFGFAALSFGVHASMVAAMFAFVPALAATDGDGMTDDQNYRFLQAMAALQEKSQEAVKEDAPTDAKLPSEGGTGAPAEGESGKMGAVNSKATNKAFAMSGGAQERTIDRTAAIQDAQNFGFVGILAGAQGGNPDSPTAAWGTETNGPDAITANGNMWGDELGEAGGLGGLGLTGVGEGGGGRFQAIGLGSVATIGHGSGSCATSNCQGFGNNSGRLSGGHKVATPKVRMSSPTVSGRIPPEVIQRAVRQNFGRFRACYESGLRNNPNLQGRVAVSFVIGRDGAVGSAQNGGSDLADSQVVSCVVRSFYGMSFPAPEGGVVRVTYPILFQPG